MLYLLEEVVVMLGKRVTQVVRPGQGERLVGGAEKSTNRDGGTLEVRSPVVGQIMQGMLVL